MKTSATGINLIKKWEGCRLTAYKDAGGVLTIGYGHTAGVKAGQKITEAEATEFLKADIVKAENKVNQYDAVYHWTQNEFDALVSFAYNIGSINQLTNYGKRTKYQIAQHITAYCNCNGKKLQGLVNRRKEEYNLFNLPCEDPEISKYVAGHTYTVKVNSLNVRSGPSTAYQKAIKTQYNKGKVVTCKAVTKDSKGNTWIQLNTGNWICAIYEGKIYVE